MKSRFFFPQRKVMFAAPAVGVAATLVIQRRTRAIRILALQSSFTESAANTPFFIAQYLPSGGVLATDVPLIATLGMGVATGQTRFGGFIHGGFNNIIGNQVAVTGALPDLIWGDCDIQIVLNIDAGLAGGDQFGQTAVFVEDIDF